MNKAFFSGNLTRDPELRHTSTGEPICTLNVADNEVWYDKANVKQEKAEYMRVQVWGKKGENCAKYLTKGQQVFCTGKMRTRQWDDKDGKKMYSTELVADEVEFGAKPQGQREDSRPSQQQNRSQPQGNSRSVPDQMQGFNPPPNQSRQQRQPEPAMAGGGGSMKNYSPEELDNIPF